MDEERLIRDAALVEDAVAAMQNRRDVVRAAGGVVYRHRDDGRIEFVLVHRPAYDDWTLPKGKLLKNERLEHGALREVHEETGMVCHIARSLGTIAYVDRRGRDKVVWYWLMRAVEGEFLARAEIDEVAWLPYAQARNKLSYTHDRVLMDRVRSHAPEAVKVFLVRHAEAGSRGDWQGDDLLRPLSKKGWRQAEKIVALLHGEPIEKILSSPAVRCRQTVEPLAAERHITIEDEPVLLEGTPWQDVRDVIRFAREPTVLCSHGDIVEALVEHLVLRGVVRDRAARYEKGSTWALKVQDSDIVAATYTPAP